jgi:hypothetical protein
MENSQRKNLNHLFRRKDSLLIGPTALSISKCMSRYEVDLAVSVVSFIQGLMR